MKSFTEYWSATLVRGLLAILTATAILFIPAMASTLLLLPFAVIISILCLAAYATIDSAIVLVTSFMIPHSPLNKHLTARLALRIQGIAGVLIGMLLFVIVYDRTDLHWFLYLAALQAAATAITEFIVARRTTFPHTAGWSYASSAIAALSAIALLFGHDFDPRQLAWLLYGYLGIFGITLFALAARMLFAERTAAHHTPA